jgi:hypothetical protein
MQSACEPAPTESAQLWAVTASLLREDEHRAPAAGSGIERQRQRTSTKVSLRPPASARTQSKSGSILGMLERKSDAPNAEARGRAGLRVRLEARTRARSASST